MTLTPTTGELKLKEGAPIPWSHTTFRPKNDTERIVRVPIPELSSHDKCTKGILMAFGYLHVSDGGAASSIEYHRGERPKLGAIE